MKDERSSHNTNRTVLELDLVSYSAIATVLEENLNVEAVKVFEDQIQAFVDHGLNTLGLHRDDIVLGTAGDNAILIFNDATTMHRFAQTVQRETLMHNRSKSVELAKRWFRMGAATGTVLVLESERRIVGSTIARAVRLEAAAHKGQLVVDLPTFEALPEELKGYYGPEEVIRGKRQERFNVRRCTLIDVSDDSSASVTNRELQPVKQLVGQKTLSHEDVSRVREYLSGAASSEERWDVIRELGKLRSTNVIPLLQEIIRESHDYNSRHLATVALGEIGPTAQTALLESLDHQEPSVRWTALQRLSKLPTSPVVISRVREILKNDSEWLVQSSAIDALGELNGIEAADDLISLLHSSRASVRNCVASVLGKFNTSEVKAALRHTVSNDPEQGPRLWAIESLVELKDVEAVSIFATLRNEDSDEYVRKAAANAYFRSKTWL